MLQFRTGSREPRSYSLKEAAEFLEFDEQAISYWLKMGHLAGRRDKGTGEWRISPQALIEFLRESQEPMPTCIDRFDEASVIADRSVVSAKA